jgi:hypothetical protein
MGIELIPDKSVRLVEKSLIAKVANYILRSNNCAIVIGNRIHLDGISSSEFLNNPTLMLHELTHVAQYRQYGFIFFIVKYLWFSLLKGYRQNPFEIQARAAEKSHIDFTHIQLTSKFLSNA